MIVQRILMKGIRAHLLHDALLSQNVHYLHWGLEEILRYAYHIHSWNN